MKKINLKYFIVLIITLIIAACSSSVRYTKRGEKIIEINRTNESVLEVETGTASFYADEFNGKKTANGEIYDMNELTAAHPSYSFGTIVKVTNLKNGLSVEVRINDRMPSFKNRIIDLSLEAAKEIDMIRDGIQEVTIEVLKWGD